MSVSDSVHASLHDLLARAAQATPEKFQMDQRFCNSLVGESLERCFYKFGTKAYESVNRDSICIPNSA